MTQKPMLARTTFGKGSAAKQDSIRKGRVQASADKLAALKERQAEGLAPVLPIRPAAPPHVESVEAEPATMTAAEPRTRGHGHCVGGGLPALDPTRDAKGTCPECGRVLGTLRIAGQPPKMRPHNPTSKEADAMATATKKAAPKSAAKSTAKKAPAAKKAASKKATAERAPRQPKADRPQLFVDGKAIAEVHNSIAGVARATGRNGGTRLSAADLRALLQKNGIDPLTAGWEFTLPNGVVLAARPAGATSV